MVGESGRVSLVTESSDISDLVPGRFIKSKTNEMSPIDTASSSVHKKLQSGEHLQPYNPAADVMPTFISIKNSGLILFTLAILGITLYLTYYLWRKHRCTMIALSKGCQYSRLNQIETDEIDSVVFCSEPVQENGHLESSREDHDNSKPATIEVITTSNYSSHTSNGSVKFDHSITSVGSDLSDEDLLQ